MDAVGDDRWELFERAQAPGVGARILLRVRGLVADRRLNQQRPSQRSRRDQLAQPVDGGVVAVGKADLDPLGRSGQVAHASNLGSGEPERLLGEHPLVRLDRRAHEPRGRGGRRRDHDRVDVGVGEDGLDVRRGAHPGRRRGEARGVEVGDGHERGSRVALERRQVGAHGDVAEADYPDPEGRVVHGPTLHRILASLDPSQPPPPGRTAQRVTLFLRSRHRRAF